jgi:hypothetical protein
MCELVRICVDSVGDESFTVFGPVTRKKTRLGLGPRLGHAQGRLATGWAARKERKGGASRAGLERRLGFGPMIQKE